MRFGLFIPQGWRFDLVGIDPADHWSAMQGLAAHADAGPWESLWVYDHFHTTPTPSDQATHEAWTLMAAFAASTSRIRLGQMCTCMSYRDPAYLAKVATTVDIVSGGRAEMGIGGGWYEHEWRAYGYGFPRAGERLARLREGVEIFRQAWSTGTATLHGEHYTVDGALFHPQPLQRGRDGAPHIPLWIAGGGEKVTLRIAAQHADYTNFGGEAETFERKSALLREHCADVGRDFGEITRSSNFNTIIGETTAEVQERIDAVEARLRPHLDDEALAGVMSGYRDPEAIAVGTVEQVTERLTAARDRGVEVAIHYFPEAAYDRTGIQLFQDRVIPALG